MQYRTLGILAHVDAGKTTLSEALLYMTGQIRKAGSVDGGDTHLDTDEIERARGITIFSSQARLRMEDMEMILLDTPGHTDFSAETERVLRVLDCAVLVISGTDGVQSHTRTLWRLLRHYGVPVLFFVNKMDLQGADREKVLEGLRRELSPECVDFGRPREEVLEEAAVCDEPLLDELMETGDISDASLRGAVLERKLFPVWFGSALRMEGLDALLDGLRRYTGGRGQSGSDGISARVYKIGRDPSGMRMTYLRVTGGVLRARMQVPYRTADGTEMTEKIDQIRLYSGDRFEQVQEAPAGQICAVTGLTLTMPGCGIGGEESGDVPVIEPVIRRSLILPPGISPAGFMRKLVPLQEEEPTLHIVWNDRRQCIDLQIMGEVQVEVVTRLIRERFGVAVTCGPGRIIYKETVTRTVEGVGHFEPLRHYAEVHLLLEPGDAGSGVTARSAVSEDDLDLHWQRLILTHILEKEHTGVLIGAGLTDVRVTLLAARAHLKHTEGGDFRQATYRAIRQGLMMTESALLEPVYAFSLEIPRETTGRAMSDLTSMSAEYGEPEYLDDGAFVRLTGTVPVSEAGSYMTEVSSYTRGEGHLSLSLLGYRPCHNPEEVIAESDYDAEADTENPASSVFCSHGAGVIIPWDQVRDYAHLPCVSAPKDSGEEEESRDGTGSLDYDGIRASAGRGSGRRGGEPLPFEEDEVLQGIYAREFGIDRNGMASGKSAPEKRNPPRGTEFRQKYDKRGNPIYPKKDERPEHLIVDGYNMIFQSEELRALAGADISAARGKLLDLLSNYQGYLGYPVTVVFDAYRTGRNPTSVNRWLNLTVVFTKENETADAYIERTVHDGSGKFRFTVATSDGMEQLTVLRLGALRMPARMLFEEMKRLNDEGLKL